MIDETNIIDLSPTVRCAIYTRFACDDMRSTSLEDQERACRAAAKQHPGWVVLDGHIYNDVGVSRAKPGGRGGLDSLLAKAKMNPRPYDCVVVNDKERISRNVVHALEIIEALHHHGVFVHFAGQNLRSDDPNFRLLLTMCAMCDEQYIEALAKKVRRGQMGRVLRGYAVGHTPFGYKRVVVEELCSPKDGKGGRPVVLGVRLEVVEAEAEVVRRIFAMCEGGRTASQIAYELNEGNIPATRGSWTSGLVRRILRDEKYRGVLVWGKTTRMRDSLTAQIRVRNHREEDIVKVTSPHLRVVTDEQWNNVQQRLKKATKIPSSRFGRAPKEVANG